MPHTLLIVVGMPGSGKTTFVRSLLESKEIDGFYDDYQFGPLKRSEPEWRSIDKGLVERLRKGEKWAIADTRFCDPLERMKLQKALRKIVPNLRFRYIYFENNPEDCQLNTTRRKGSLPRREINLIYYYTALYKIPKSAETMPIKTDW